MVIVMAGVHCSLSRWLTRRLWVLALGFMWFHARRILWFLIRSGLRRYRSRERSGCVGTFIVIVNDNTKAFGFGFGI